MSIKLLDCTLREGAYVVDAHFGYNTIISIINLLSSSGIEIIECGRLANCCFDKNSVYFANPCNIEHFIAKKSAQIALMFDFGKYNVENIPRNNGAVDIIRIAFYKKNLDEISFIAEKVKEKGYKVFLQPSNIMEYNNSDLAKLCKRSNFIGIDAVYIVDSFGSMFPEDLTRFISFFDNYVDAKIDIGFHSHNSLQLSFALSMQFINSMQRNIIVDSSLCGIGRGAGITKTELLTEFLSRNNKNYNIDTIWQCLEKNILPLYKKYNWEYTPDKAYRGIHGLHPTQII